MRGNGADGDPYLPERIRAERGSAAASGGSVYAPGVSERTLAIVVVVPFIVVAILGVVAMVMASSASTAAARAVDRAMIAERESRLAQEDLTLLRAKVAAAGIEVESAGDHQ